MSINRQAGFVSGALTSLIVTIVLLLGAIGFGAWAYMSRQDYKTNSDKKALKAADARQTETEKKDAAKYAEEAKNPLTSHKAPDQFGGVTVQYPKTWSAYVIETTQGNEVVDDYFHPGAVPGVQSKDAAYALRIQIVNQAYDRVVKSYENSVTTQKLAASVYALPKVPTVVGTRFDGEVVQNKQGSLIVLPVRNMTLKIWTEAPSFLADFNNIILPNLTFSP